ncbi:hypothetical protein U9M48_034526 [Paspalum notatum var. saurae]|uniref:Uncharacterized protein n=1 Tax=Paspalum notatum var. saurae TaxID=547442 RepID=A0AAQ3UAX7_PASNO
MQADMLLSASCWYLLLMEIQLQQQKLAGTSLNHTLFGSSLTAMHTVGWRARKLASSLLKHILSASRLSARQVVGSRAKQWMVYMSRDTTAKEICCGPYAFALCAKISYPKTNKMITNCTCSS